MKCPYCRTETQVIDSRDAPKSNSIRRRRQCPHCKNRFTTHETVYTPQLIEAKKRRIGDGENFESWLTAISSRLPPHVVAKLNLGELRRWYEAGIDLEQVIQQYSKPALTPAQQAKVNLIKAKLKAKIERTKQAA
jgi:hypothetical protein